MIWILAILLIIILVVLVRCIVIVPQSNAYVTEWLGCGPAHPHALRRAHLPQSFAERGSRRLSPAACYHPR